MHQQRVHCCFELIALGLSSVYVKLEHCKQRHKAHNWAMSSPRIWRLESKQVVTA